MKAGRFIFAPPNIPVLTKTPLKLLRPMINSLIKNAGAKKLNKDAFIDT